MSKAISKDQRDGRIEGLRHAIAICQSRNLPMFNQAYREAAIEIKVFLEAALERTEQGEDMSSYAETQ